MHLSRIRGRDPSRQTIASLRAAEERLRIIFDRAPVGIFETDLEGRFVRVNDAFCDLTGRSREVLLALHSRDITDPDDLACAPRSTRGGNS